MKKLLTLSLALLIATSVHAEKADRDKPVNLEADRITVDDANKVQIFEGNVQLVKGTLIIRTDKLVVTQDEGGFQTGVAYGGANGLAYFRQKREGRDDYAEGWGERINHDDRNEKTEFLTRAHFKSGGDEARGKYIAYDGRTESYVVTTGDHGTNAPKIAGKDQRVRAVIQPKNKEFDPKLKPKPDTVPLKAARSIKSAPEE